MRNTISLFAILFALAPATAAVRLSVPKIKVAPTAGASSLAAGASLNALPLSGSLQATNLTLPTLNTTVLPQAAALTADPAQAATIATAQQPKKLTAKGTLAAVAKAAPKAAKGGTTQSNTIARTYDGGAKSAAAINTPVLAPQGDLSPRHMAGLRHQDDGEQGFNADFAARDEVPATRKQPARQPDDIEPFDIRKAIAGAVVFVVLASAVVLEYGAIYYMFSNMEIHVPTEQEFLYEIYGDQINNWGFPR
jgi:hypothetical protein